MMIEKSSGIFLDEFEGKMEQSNILHYHASFLLLDVSCVIIEVFIIFPINSTKMYPSINFHVLHNSIIIIQCSIKRPFEKKLRFVHIMAGRDFIMNSQDFHDEMSIFYYEQSRFSWWQVEIFSIVIVIVVAWFRRCFQ